MRGATRVSPQLHQILRLPRSLKGQDCKSPSNLIYLLPPKELRFDTDPSLQHFAALLLSPKIPRNGAPARKGHSPPSPNTAPAAKSHCPPPPPRKPLMIDPRHMKRHLQCAEQVIRTHSDHESARRFGDLTRRILETHFGWKNETFRAPAISQNFTKCCACREKSQSTSPNRSG